MHNTHTLAQIIVARLGAPDIVALEEIQDNNGTTDDGNVAADQTYARLIAAIASASGPTYQYRQIDPVSDRDGGAPGGNIRVGFLYRTAVGSLSALLLLKQVCKMPSLSFVLRGGQIISAAKPDHRVRVETPLISTYSS